MIERVKLWFYSNKTWIYNIQYIVYSIALLIVVMLVDLRYYEIQDYIPRVFFTSVSLAKTILAALAGAQLTITTFTFSTILSVMSSYLSNFTPRAVENFVEKKITMKVLGIFFGGFFYSITALVFMRDLLEDKLVIAGFVGVVYAVVSMFYFIIFVQKVIYSSNVENLVSEIHEDTLKVIKGELEQRKEYKSFFVDDDVDTKSIDLYPNSNGYLSVIDFSAISSTLSDIKCELIVDRKIGDFVNVEKVVAHIKTEESIDFDEEIMGKIADSFILRPKKVYENDYRHGIDKIEEIAIRALSPGINDPNTAVYCIHNISLLLTYLSKSTNNHIVMKENENVKIYYTSHSFEDDLYQSFNQIIHYGKEDVDVMYSVFEALETLVYSSTGSNKSVVTEFAQDVYENLMVTPSGAISCRKLEEIYNSIMEETQEKD